MRYPILAVIFLLTISLASSFVEFPSTTYEATNAAIITDGSHTYETEGYGTRNPNQGDIPSPELGAWSYDVAMAQTEADYIILDGDSTYHSYILHLTSDADVIPFDEVTLDSTTDVMSGYFIPLFDPQEIYGATEIANCTIDENDSEVCYPYNETYYAGLNYTEGEPTDTIDSSVSLDWKMVIEIPFNQIGHFNISFTANEAEQFIDPDISAGPYIINSSGLYNLTGNIAVNGFTAITINASNVTVDCLGFSITGNNTTATYGIYSTHFNSTIRNCIINNFSIGIYIKTASANYSTLVNNTINQSYNTSCSGSTGVCSAITISGASYAQMANNTETIHGDGDGVNINSGGFLNYVSNNTAISGNRGVFIVSSSNNTITNSFASNQSTGIYIYSGSNNTLINDTSNDSSSYGFVLFSTTDRASIINCSSYNAGLRGFFLVTSPSNNNLTGNYAYNATQYGFFLSGSSGNYLHNNIAVLNSIGFYLQSNSNNNTLDGNYVYNSSSRGIYLFASGNNTIINNYIQTINDTLTNGVIYFATSNDNNITNNTFNSSASGASRSPPVYILTGQNNIMKNNTLITASNSITSVISIAASASGNNTFYQNTLTGPVWVKDLNGTSIYNVSGIGNIYYYPNGTGIWERAPNGTLLNATSPPSWSSSSYGVNATNWPGFWVGNGTDYWAWTNNSNGIVANFTNISSISIWPSAPTTNLSCNVTAINSNDATMLVNVSFYKNGVLQNGPQNLTATKTCTNSSTQINTCANATNILNDGINWTITEQAGPPFNGTINLTNSSINLSNAFNLVINAGYFYTAGPHYVEVEIWNGTDWEDLYNLTTNAFGLTTRRNFSTAKYAPNGSVWVNFNHHPIGNSAHTGIVVDYMAIEPYSRYNITNNTVSLLGNITNLTVGDNWSCSAQAWSSTTISALAYSANVTIQTILTSNLTVINGTGSATNFTIPANLSINASMIINYTFVNWSVVAGNCTIANTTESLTTAEFLNTTSACTVQANFNFTGLNLTSNLTVLNGTGSAFNFVIPANRSIVANVVTDHTFFNWTIIYGNCTIHNSTSSSTYAEFLNNTPNCTVQANFNYTPTDIVSLVLVYPTNNTYFGPANCKFLTTANVSFTNNSNNRTLVCSLYLNNVFQNNKSVGMTTNGLQNLTFTNLILAGVYNVSCFAYDSNATSTNASAYANLWGMTGCLTPAQNITTNTTMNITYVYTPIVSPYVDVKTTLGVLLAGLGIFGAFYYIIRMWNIRKGQDHF